MKRVGVALEDLLVATKDGDWGKSEPILDHSPHRVIRGADFEAARIGDVSSIPMRYMPNRTVWRRTLIANDILIETAGGTTDRPTGRTLLVTQPMLDKLGLPTTCASFARYLRVDPELAEPAYIYWYLQNLHASGQMRQHEVRHTGVGRFQYTRFAHSEVIELPSRPQQKAVAYVLGLLDQKIRSTYKISQLARELAQKIYTHWFVNMGPWSGKRPHSWADGHLGDLLNLVKAPTKADASTDLPYVPIDMIPARSLGLRDFNPGGEAKTSLQLFQKNDILVGAMRVYFHRVALAPFDGITRNTCFVLRPLVPAYLAYCLMVCNEDASISFANATSKGSTMPYAVWDGGLRELPVTIPPAEVAESFSQHIFPLLERNRDALHELRALRALRDKLAPELLAGRMDVGKVTAAIV